MHATLLNVIRDMFEHGSANIYLKRSSVGRSIVMWRERKPAPRISFPHLTSRLCVTIRVQVCNNLDAGARRSFKYESDVNEDDMICPMYSCCMREQVKVAYAC